MSFKCFLFTSVFKWIILHSKMINLFFLIVLFRLCLISSCGKSSLKGENYKPLTVRHWRLQTSSYRRKVCKATDTKLCYRCLPTELHQSFTSLRCSESLSHATTLAAQLTWHHIFHQRCHKLSASPLTSECSLNG